MCSKTLLMATINVSRKIVQGMQSNWVKSSDHSKNYLITKVTFKLLSLGVKIQYIFIYLPFIKVKKMNGKLDMKYDKEPRVTCTLFTNCCLVQVCLLINVKN